MAKFCILSASCISSTLVWLLADKLGCSFSTSFILSSLAALVGCWPGWVIYRRYLS